MNDRVTRCTSRLGYTLTEMMLVVAVVSAILLVGAPVYQTLQVTTEVDVATNVIATDLNRAQSYARSVAHDTSWGVVRSGQAITIFSGSSYAARNPAYDETYTLSNALTLGGDSAIVFSKLTGLPAAAGAMTVTGGGKTRTITWNGKGMVDY